MPSRLLVALFLLAPLALASPQARPQDDQANTLVFNVSTNGHPPFTIANEDGTITGIFWEVLEHIARKQGITLKPVQLPTKRVDNFILEGQVDVTMRAIEWTDQPDQFIFTDPVVTTSDAVFVHRSKVADIDSLDDLDGKLLLIRLGFHYPDLDPAFKEGRIEFIELQDETSMFRRLLEGKRFDGAVTNEEVGRWVLLKNGWNGTIRVAPLKFDEVPYRLMFGRQHEAFVERFNQELQTMKESGELERIMENYR